ncbi:MAG: cobalamin biosynthesis protein CbiA, partial [Deltaproteobacteria bacterium]|nr:cobalamin biosynthesis protein CbiA [Deltaproteobacteria bacterium]
MKGQSVQMLQVVNPLRPGTSTVKGCLEMQRSIEKMSGLPMNGYVGNANLIDETTVKDIYEGYEFVKNLSDKSGLPLEFITIPREILPKTDLGQ